MGYFFNLWFLIWNTKKDEMPTMTNMLYEPEPSKILFEISFFAKNTPAMLVNSSVIDEPAARIVAPATCARILSFSNDIYSIDGIKYSSQTCSAKT